MPIILGIDPGSHITGFGIIEADNNKYNYIASGNISTTEKSLSDKLQQIFSGISKLAEKHQPEEAAIEQVFIHANINSALKLGQARGVAMVAATQKKIKIAEYSARQIKQAVVGYGNAEKSQVQHMVKILLKLKETPKPDEADALAVAICHANSRSGIYL